MSERPNIVYLHSHDTGRYIQPYGHPVAMPNYQRLADEGVLFRQAFCAAPTCTPSRAALLTGQSPHASGLLGLAHRGFRLNDPKQHLAHTLKAVGYTTVLAGVQHVAANSAIDTLGYDVLHAKPKEAETFAASFLDNAPSQPFLLDVGFNETHRMGEHFHPDGPKGDGRYCRPPAPLPDTPETRADMASYWEAARTLDAKVGVVLDALDRNGLRDNTLILTTTDHGLAFPRMKCNLTDHGIGVLLMLRWPEAFKAGRVVDSLVSQVDVFPTLCDLLEMEKPAWLTGTSLLPVLEGNTDEVNDAIFAEVTYHAGYEPMRAVRTKQWKYIRRFEERNGPVLPNCDDSPSKDVLLANGWRERPPAMEALYDLIFDPNEAHNLATSPVYTGVLTDMRERLDTWMRVTNDPLLNGPMPPPPGSVFNDPNGLSPREPTLTAA
jgi:N-sulfoglucosamine sulfohydrolase